MGAFAAFYQRKIHAIQKLELALFAKRTMTGQDDLVINPMLKALQSEEDAIRAAQANDNTTVLNGPTAADATALQNAIKAAEDAIAQNASINNLANAAAVLIGTVKTS